MLDLILITLSSLLSGLRGQAALQAENIALRHQVTVLQRTHTKRPVLKPGDRCLWVWLSRLWSGWRSALIIVMPETVHRLASSRISLVLDLEDSARKGRTASSSETDPRFDSNHEPREPDSGRTPDPQRADEVGHSDLGGFDCQVHDPTSKTTIPDVA